MTQIIPRVGKILGAPDGGWSQVHTFVPQEEEKQEARGQLIAVICAKFPKEGIEAVEAGREILARLHEEYFGKTDDLPFAALKKAAASVGQEFDQKEIEVTIVAMVLWQDFVYLTIWGEGKVAVLRDSQLGFLDKSVSGQIHDGDMFLLGTGKFFEVIGEGVVRAALKTRNPVEAEELLLPQVHQSSDQAELAAAVVKTDVLESPGQLLTKEKEGPKEKSQPGKVASFLVSFAKRLPEQPIYVKGDRERSKKTAFTAALILLILLLISSFLGFRQHRLNLFRASYETQLLEAQDKLTQALDLSDLNPVRARQLVSEVRTAVSDLDEQGIKDERLAQLKTQLGEVLGSVFGEYEVEGALFLDLSIIRDGLVASSLTASGEEILVFDREGNRVVSFNFAGKNTQILAGSGEVGGARLAAFYAGRVFVLKDDGIWEVGEGRAENVVENEDWGEILFFEAYGGNLYLVDQTLGEIWRYPGGETGFGVKQRWFGSGMTADFSKAQDSTIDGSIWFLEEDGKVRKFTRGAPESFSFRDFGENFRQPQAIFASDTTDNLYILDPLSAKIFVFAKKGEYQKTLIWEGLSQARDFVVSEETGKVLILTGDKIWEIALP